jgi:hypothetical protein
MNHHFAALADEDRQLAFANAGIAQGMAPAILEKDFWVSWLLGLLFGLPEVKGRLVFKGGTSLSKVFGIIDRFSEDIDLSLAPEFVGADTREIDAIASRVKRDAAMQKLQMQCAAKVSEVLMPALESAIIRVLGDPAQGEWLHFEMDDEAKSPVVWFRYPSVGISGFEYLDRAVKLELGALTDQQPTGDYAVQALVSATFPQLFEDWSVQVTALELQRTFWEKATILHAEHHRPAGSSTPARYARHYFDMARLLEHADGARHLTDHDQCARVVDWKSRMFARAWARYDLASPGSFRLVPAQARIEALAQDYATMRPMFMSEPPEFDDLMAVLADAEKRLNG